MADIKKIEESGYRLPASWKEGAAPAENKADDSDLDSKTTDELQTMADEQGVEVKGTGKGGNVLKADLVKALGG